MRSQTPLITLETVTPGDFNLFHYKEDNVLTLLQYIKNVISTNTI